MKSGQSFSEHFSINNNRKVYLLGLIMIIITSFFPPYLGYYQDKDRYCRLDMGYHFIFLKAKPSSVHVELFGHSSGNSINRVLPYRGDWDKPYQYTEKEKINNIKLGSKWCYTIIDYKLYFFQVFIILNGLLLLIFLKEKRPGK